MESETVEEVVVVDRSSKEHVIAVAKEQGVEVQEPPAKGFEPVATVTLLLLGTVSAVGTVVYLIDKEKGGQVVDLRPGALKAFYRDPEVAYGLVVIIAKDGSAKVEVKEPKGMFGIVVQAITEAVAGLVGKDLKAVASAVEAAVGDKGNLAFD